MVTIPHLPDKIVIRSTNDLIPYARNARTHSPAQVSQIAASIKEFGFTNDASSETHLIRWRVGQEMVTSPSTSITWSVTMRDS